MQGGDSLNGRTPIAVRIRRLTIEGSRFKSCHPLHPSLGGEMIRRTLPQEPRLVMVLTGFIKIADSLVVILTLGKFHTDFVMRWLCSEYCERLEDR